MHNINLDREILKLIEEQPEISEREIAHTLSVSEELVKLRISSLHDIREKILIMGHGNNVHNNLQKVLEAENYNVVSTLDNFSALETVNAEKPDLVLLDTDMDAFEICRQLKASPRHWWVPVMMLSERDKTEDGVKAFNSGADDYITMPFNPLELKARVGMILRRCRI
ncbi:response regulator [Methanosarcina siciliae]|nr:response regulator [Methanosarcina siciliae]